MSNVLYKTRISIPLTVVLLELLLVIGCVVDVKKD